MKKIVWFMHVSLDGFVAGPDGEMDWIKVDENLFVYAGRRTDEADTALYGRKTWQMMEAYWPTAAGQPNATQHDIEHSTWYNKVQKVVVSKTMQNENPPNTTIINENIPAEISKLKQGTGKEIVIFGSPSIGHLLTAENLIDDYWLFVNPILLGQGIPLFKDLKDRISLKLVTSHTFASGVICLHYENSHA